MTNKINIFKPLLLSFALLLTLSVFGNEPNESDSKNNVPETGKSEPFHAGKFIIDHVSDKYEWHLWGPEENPTSIPLPVILYSKTKGLNIFLSSKLDEGNVYNGYKYAAKSEEGKTELDKGRIVSEDGSKFYDFSITRAVAGLLICSILLLLIFISVAKSYTSRKGLAPKGFQSLIEPLILFVRDDIAKQSIGERHYARFIPFLLSLFFFIFISNLIGLIPSFPGLMGNISVAFTFALIVLVITLFIGKKHYWQHIFWMPGVPAWVKICLLTPIEVIGIIQRPFVLMIRIFANVAAGHIVILSFICLIFVFSAKGEAGGWGFSPISMAFALFMNAMELLVAFLQAYVFTLLTAMYFGSCVEEPHHEDHTIV
jgi:F-type H+-transporting ATPase subunit a